MAPSAARGRVKDWAFVITEEGLAENLLVDDPELEGPGAEGA